MEVVANAFDAPARLLRELRHALCLAESEFNNEPAVRRKAARRLRQELADHVESGGPAEHCRVGLVADNFRLHARRVRFRNVGRIRDDQVGGLVDADENIRASERDALDSSSDVISSDEPDVDDSSISVT